MSFSAVSDLNDAAAHVWSRPRSRDRRRCERGAGHRVARGRRLRHRRARRTAS